MAPFLFFFFNDTATTEIYTLSLHDALPIWFNFTALNTPEDHPARSMHDTFYVEGGTEQARSEEHTSELQSLAYLVCRLLLEKKKNKRLGRGRSHREITTSSVQARTRVRRDS